MKWKIRNSGFVAACVVLSTFSEFSTGSFFALGPPAVPQRLSVNSTAFLEPQVRLLEQSHSVVRYNGGNHTASHINKTSSKVNVGVRWWFLADEIYNHVVRGELSVLCKYFSDAHLVNVATACRR
jgi:hypothetical protein